MITNRLRIEPVVWLVAAVFAVAFPVVATDSYYVSIAITTLVYLCLAVAFDLVVGRIGALSLCQPVFYGVGAYAAALLNAKLAWTFLPVLGVAALGAAILAIVIGVPSFRLSLHSFAIGTMGFAVIAMLVAQNWVGLTGGPLCATGVGPIDVLGNPITDIRGQYAIILALAALAVIVYRAISGSRLGLALTSVRDDPILATARGMNPNSYRITAFAISAALSSSAGVFSAHYQSVVCPDQMSGAYMTTLLIIVFVGGRASLRGVVTAAIVFGALPDLLRVANEWRLVIYGVLLLLVVTALPDGVEKLYRVAGRQVRRVTPGRTRPPDDAPPDDGPVHPEPREVRR